MPRDAACLSFLFLTAHVCRADIVASDPGFRGAGRYIFDHKGLDFI